MDGDANESMNGNVNGITNGDGDVSPMDESNGITDGILDQGQPTSRASESSTANRVEFVISDNDSGIDEDTDDVDRPPIREFGHEYHWTHRFFVPHDPYELAYQHYQHELFRLCLEEDLTLSRIHELAYGDRLTILDVGTGCGVWAVEMGNTYRDAAITGVDFTASLFPRPINCPDNVAFEVYDVTEPWPEAVSYDFIYMRDLVDGGIQDWAEVVDEAFAHLNPGGKLEFAQLDSYLSEAPATGPDEELGPSTQEHRDRFIRACERENVEFDPARRVFRHLSENPHAHPVTEHVMYVPAKIRSAARAEVPKAAMVWRILPLLLENRSLELFNRCGIAESYTRSLIRQVLREQWSRRYNASLRMTIITATKALHESEDIITL